MSFYNLTNLTNSQNIGEVALYANNASEGVLFGFGVIAIFFVIFAVTKLSNNFDASLLFSSLVGFILSSILTAGGFLNILFPLGFLTILAFTGFYMWLNRT